MSTHAQRACTSAPSKVSSFTTIALRVGAVAAAGAVASFAPDAFAAGGGTPIDQAATNAVDIAQGLGIAATTAGLIGACAGAMMRNGAIMAGGATATVCGGAWAGSPDVVQQVIGGAAGAGLSDLANLHPAVVDPFAVLSSIVTSLLV